MSYAGANLESGRLIIFEAGEISDGGEADEAGRTIPALLEGDQQVRTTCDQACSSSMLVQ